MEQFDTRAAEEIGYYVYALIDPRSNAPFYIGKGKGNRVFQHAKAAISSPEVSDKLDIIRDIRGAGHQVEKVIIQHGLTEVAAFSIEAALIDFAGYFDIGLANLVLGHNSSVTGIMTTDEIKRRYEAEPLTHLEDGCVIININKTYKRARGSKGIYEATRKSWVISEDRIPTLKYVLSEFGGFIVEVFEVDPGGWYKAEESGGRVRWAFHGNAAPESIRNRYLNRSIKKKRGAANPIAYKLSDD